MGKLSQKSFMRDSFEVLPHVHPILNILIYFIKSKSYLSVLIKIVNILASVKFNSKIS